MFHAKNGNKRARERKCAPILELTHKKRKKRRERRKYNNTITNGIIFNVELYELNEKTKIRNY